MSESPFSPILKTHTRLREVATDEIWEIMIIGFLKESGKPPLPGGELIPATMIYKMRNEKTRAMEDVKDDQIGEGMRFVVIEDETS